MQVVKVTVHSKQISNDPKSSQECEVGAVVRHFDSITQNWRECLPRPPSFLGATHEKFAEIIANAPNMSMATSGKIHVPAVEWSSASCPVVRVRGPTRLLDPIPPQRLLEVFFRQCRHMAVTGR